MTQRDFSIGLSSEGGAISSNQRTMYRRFLVKSGQRMNTLGWNKVELRITNGLRDLYTVEPPAYHRL